MGEFAIGQSVARTEDPKFLMGRGRFLDDITLPRQAHAVVLRSPHAHALILSLDIRAAQQSAGVVGIFTGEDWAAEGFGSLPCTEKLKRPDGGDMYKPFHPALVTGEVRRVGDPIAFVVAESIDLSKDAAEKIAVEYDPLPSVSSIEASSAPGAPAVWEDCPDNICFQHLQGDADAVEAAFNRAAHVISDSFTVNRVSANTMEPRGCIGHYDAGQDRYTLYTGLQNPHQVRGQMAHDIFHMDETKFHIIPGDIGGSFGMRGGTYPELPLVLWASQKIGRPVKWVSERSEGLMSDDHARDCMAEASLALDADGKFLALRVKNKANVGAYLGVRAPRPPVGNLATYCGVYATPAVHVDISAYFTNTNCFNPYRGSGGPEAGFVLERLIDKAAQSLHMDPADLRRRNLIPSSAMPYTNPLGYVYDCGEFDRVMERALSEADYAGFEARRAEARARGKLRGRGLANAIKKTSIPTIETAAIRFDAGGGVRLMMGTISHGQGHDTVFKQILNDRLGIAPEKVTLIEGDTDLTSFGGGTFGSRSTAMGGSAIVRASEKILEKAMLIAAHLLEASGQDIAFDDGVFTVAGTDRSVDFTTVAKAAFTPGQIPDDMEPGLDKLASFRPPAQNWPSTSHVVEIEIDPATGTLEIIRYVVVEDLGMEINPMLVDGQTHGGLAQTMGQAMMEAVVFDPDSGQLLSGSFMDYAMPRADDFPMFERLAEPLPTKTNPLGVKGGGELAPVACLPAMFNALDDALSGADVAMPATPERIWRALGK